MRVRFAPSPTGNLHIGSARTALYNWLFAKANNGSFIVRVEDTDIARSTKQFEEAILSDLKWLGLDWNEGPGISGDYAPYHQSKRLELYKKKTDYLLKKGLAYECFCLPEELEVERKKALAESRMPKYSGKCAVLSEEETRELKSKGLKPSVRFKMPDRFIDVYDIIHGKVSFDGSIMGDFVILRSDGSPTFHLSVVVDDAEMEITHVIRGDDHLPNTPKHVVLFEALDYKVPKFAHHSLIKGKDGAKLSKRHGAAAVFEYREQGYLPEAIDNYLALLSWTPPKGEILGRKELVKEFRIKGLSKSPAIFDIDKLNWLNGQHIRLLDNAKLTELCLPFYKLAGLDVTLNEELVFITASIKDNLVKLSEAPDYASVYFEKDISYGLEVEDYVKTDVSKTVFKTAAEKLAGNNISEPEKAKEYLNKLALELKDKGIKGKNVFMPLRVALTASTTGPELIYLLSVFGKEKIKERLQKAIEFN